MLIAIARGNGGISPSGGTNAPGTTFDGELVAVSERDGKPTQDFAAVTRGVFTGKLAAMDRLRFVAFDLLAGAGGDPGRVERVLARGRGRRVEPCELSAAG